MHIYFRCTSLSKKTLKIVKESGNDAILQLKDNQKKLAKKCEKITKQIESIDEYFDNTEWHWRKEFRKSEVFNAKNLRISLDKEWLEYVESIIKVTRKTKTFDTKTKTWKERSEISYYISTFSSTAKVFHYAIRSHWWIENRNHYVKDVTMKEDLSRIRVNPQNFAKLRSFWLNIMRKEKVTDVENEMYENVLDINNMLVKYADII